MSDGQNKNYTAEFVVLFISLFVPLGWSMSGLPPSIELACLCWAISLGVLLHFFWLSTKKWHVGIRSLGIVIIPITILLFSWKPIQKQYRLQHHPPEIPAIALATEPKIVTNFVEVPKPDPKAIMAMDRIIDNQESIKALIPKYNLANNPVIMIPIIALQNDVDAFKISQTDNVEAWAAKYLTKQHDAEIASQIAAANEMLESQKEYASHLSFIKMTMDILTNMCGDLAKEADDTMTVDFQDYQRVQNQKFDDEILIAIIKFNKNGDWNFAIKWNWTYQNLRFYGNARFPMEPPSGRDSFDFTTNSPMAIKEYQNQVRESLKEPIGALLADLLKRNRQ